MVQLFRDNIGRGFMNEGTGQFNPLMNNIVFEPDLDIQETGNVK